VLATSREPLCIEGELIWRVPSLPVPEIQSEPSNPALEQNAAVKLFVQRAAAAKPQFALSARNAAAVAHICGCLDGLPQALELAAARVEALTAEQLAARLDQRFRLLAGPSRTALPRQRTLWATLDWSYQLLSEAERQLFERFAVFSGGWTLEAAEAVGADGGLAVDEVVELLANLVRKSLVVAEEQADGTQRYRLLETVREYARERLVARGAADQHISAQVTSTSIDSSGGTPWPKCRAYHTSCRCQSAAPPLASNHHAAIVNGRVGWGARATRACVQVCRPARGCVCRTLAHALPATKRVGAKSWAGGDVRHGRGHGARSRR